MSKARTPNPEEIDPDWSKYPETILHFTSGLSIDLRQPLSPAAVEGMRLLGLVKPFAVMTAHDPNGRNLDAEENRLRAEQLERELAAGGFRYLRVEACSPDAGHCESSVAVSIDQDQAVEIAKAFQQVAIFWFDGTMFWIVGGVVAGDPVMLPRPF